MGMAALAKLENADGLMLASCQVRPLLFESVSEASGTSCALGLAPDLESCNARRLPAYEMLQQSWSILH